MELHKNARTYPASRMLLFSIQARFLFSVAAEAAGVSRRNASKWKGPPNYARRTIRTRCSGPIFPRQRLRSFSNQSLRG